MPNFIKYHESIASELDSVQSRIRNLVTHWLTDGEWKEAVLRTVLRRHLPEGSFVGRGFVVGREYSSTQIDFFVLRQGKPTLFKDGDLVIVTPDVPGAVVEVKTKLEGVAAWYETALKLSQIGQACKQIANNNPWLGIYAYEGALNQDQNILNAICRVHRETGISINCVTCGDDLFVRYWSIGEYEAGDDPDVDLQRKYWRGYELPRLSPSYFISNLVDAICNVDRNETDYAWFAHQGGKKPHMRIEKRLDECGPE